MIKKSSITSVSNSEVIVSFEVISRASSLETNGNRVKKRSSKENFERVSLLIDSVNERLLNLCYQNRQETFRNIQQHPFISEITEECRLQLISEDENSNKESEHAQLEGGSCCRRTDSVIWQDRSTDFSNYQINQCYQNTYSNTNPYFMASQPNLFHRHGECHRHDTLPRGIINALKPYYDRYIKDSDVYVTFVKDLDKKIKREASPIWNFFESQKPFCLQRSSIKQYHDNIPSMRIHVNNQYPIENETVIPPVDKAAAFKMRKPDYGESCAEKVKLKGKKAVDDFCKQTHCFDPCFCKDMDSRTKKKFLIHKCRNRFRNPNETCTSTSTETSDDCASEGKTERFCKVCQIVTPPQAYHCPVCNVCIRRRDHHCFFLGHCVGEDNFGYFIVFLFWSTWGLFGSALYSLLYLFNHYPDKNILVLLFPAYLIFYDNDLSKRMPFSDFLIVTLFNVALLLGFFSLFYFVTCMTLASEGRTMYEQRKGITPKQTLTETENLEKVLGRPWITSFALPCRDSEYENMLKCRAKRTECLSTFLSKKRVMRKCCEQKMLASLPKKCKPPVYKFQGEEQEDPAERCKKMFEKAREKDEEQGEKKEKIKSKNTDEAQKAEMDKKKEGESAVEDKKERKNKKEEEEIEGKGDDSKSKEQSIKNKHKKVEGKSANQKDDSLKEVRKRLKISEMQEIKKHEKREKERREERRQAKEILAKAKKRIENLNKRMDEIETVLGRLKNRGFPSLTRNLDKRFIKSLQP